MVGTKEFAMLTSQASQASAITPFLGAAADVLGGINVVTPQLGLSYNAHEDLGGLVLMCVTS